MSKQLNVLPGKWRSVQQNIQTVQSQELQRSTLCQTWCSDAQRLDIRGWMQMVFTPYDLFSWNKYNINFNIINNTSNYIVKSLLEDAQEQIEKVCCPGIQVSVLQRAFLEENNVRLDRPHEKRHPVLVKRQDGPTSPLPMIRADNPWTTPEIDVQKRPAACPTPTSWHQLASGESQPQDAQCPASFSSGAYSFPAKTGQEEAQRECSRSCPTPRQKQSWTQRLPTIPDSQKQNQP